jgi:outer membrane protein assembly complex protein YaeT
VSNWRHAVVLAALCFLGIATTSAAQESQEPPIVSSVRLNGVEHVSEDELKSVLATRTGSRLPWGRKRRFNRAQFEADLRRIRAFYADRGYPDARVTSHEVREKDDGRAVDVTINVSEGEPVILEKIEYYGFEPLDSRDRRRLERFLGRQVGHPRTQAGVDRARSAGQGILRERGFAYATVELLEAQGSAPRRVYVVLAATLGPPSRFGPIEVTGNQQVSDEVVSRQLAFKPGDTYRTSRVQDSQRRLYELELLDFATIDTRGGEHQPAEVPIRVTVTEGKPRRVEFGLGYGSEERARARISWRHVNFLGGARTAGIQGKISGLERGTRLHFEEPAFLRPNLTLSLGWQYWYADEPGFDLLTTGGRATLTRESSWRDPVRRRQATTTVSATFINEYEDYTISRETLEEALVDSTVRDELIALGLDPRTGEGRGTLRALGIDVQRDTTGNLLNASRGYLVGAHLEQAGRWLTGTWNYYEARLEGRYYLSIRRRAVWANQVRMGSFFGAEPIALNVPFFKRYFLGGSSSVRGWSRFEVSPLSLAGLPLGGHSMLEASSELRVPIVGKISGVVFLDAGNVWRQALDFRLHDLEYAAGPGLRYLTPIGPVRVDFGFQLTRVEGLRIDGEPESRHWRLHFSIGQAF